MSEQAPRNFVNSDAVVKRKVFAKVSIASGNGIQIGGLAAACAALVLAGSTDSSVMAVAAMLGAWVLSYFFCHGIAHWLVGRMVGIRFRHYTIGGTANPQGWPVGLRQIFDRLPFFGVQTEKDSMQSASGRAKAWMWSAGVTSSAGVPTLGAFVAWRMGIAWSGWFLLFAIVWAFGTISSNWRSETGDYAKARRALGKL